VIAAMSNRNLHGSQLDPAASAKPVGDGKMKGVWSRMFKRKALEKRKTKDEIERLRRVFADEFEKIELEERISEWVRHSKSNHPGGDDSILESEPVIQKEKKSRNELLGAASSMKGASTVFSSKHVSDHDKREVQSPEKPMKSSSAPMSSKQQPSTETSQNIFEKLALPFLEKVPGKEPLVADSTSNDQQDGLARLWASLAKIDVDIGIGLFNSALALAAAPLCVGSGAVESTHR
jgi:hypothetical protein